MLGLSRVHGFRVLSETVQGLSPGLSYEDSMATLMPTLESTSLEKSCSENGFVLPDHRSKREKPKEKK
jgi:hypothetical protein